MPRNPDKTDYSQGFPEGFEIFSSISDPRNGGHTRHHFGGILYIASAAVLCGVSLFRTKATSRRSSSKGRLRRTKSWYSGRQFKNEEAAIGMMAAPLKRQQTNPWQAVSP